MVVVEVVLVSMLEADSGYRIDADMRVGTPCSGDLKKGFPTLFAGAGPYRAYRRSVAGGRVLR